jgi:hypothetical protein
MARNSQRRSKSSDVAERISASVSFFGIDDLERHDLVGFATFGLTEIVIWEVRAST